jgi:hypothetical protein
MIMDRSNLERLIARFLDAWNAQDVERVTACYTEDVRYRDPNTRGHVEGREALRRYLRKLFAAWQMYEQQVRDSTSCGASPFGDLYTVPFQAMRRRAVLSDRATHPGRLPRGA